MVAHRLAFLADARLPWSGAIPGLGRLFADVVAGFGEVVGALPAVIGPEDCARRL